MQKTLLLSLTLTSDTTSLDNASELSHHAEQNTSLWDDCVKVAFSQMEYLPWDNPDNIISEQGEAIVRRLKNNLLVLLFLIGGPANLLSMAVFYKQGLGDRVNLCLFVLAFCDGLFLLVSMLIHGEQLHIQFTTKERFGPVLSLLTNHNVTALLASTFISPVLSAIIATERCLCVLNPLRFQTLLRTRTVAAAIAASSVVITSLYFIVVYRYRVGCFYDPVSGAVTTTLIEGPFYQTHRELIDRIHSFFLGFGLPGVEMIVVMTTTLITIIKLRQVVTWRSGATSLISPKEVALTKILVGSSVFFIACITPVTLIRFSKLFLPEVNSGRRRHNFYLAGVWLTELFSFVNSTFNFFIYYAMGSRFRQTLWSLFKRQVKAVKR